MSAKAEKEFGENVEKWVAGLAAPKRNKVRNVLSYAFVTNNRGQGRTEWSSRIDDTLNTLAGKMVLHIRSTKRVLTGRDC